MSETKEEFMERIVVNHVNSVVLVFPKKAPKGTPTIWSYEQARKYLDYLENEGL